MPDVGELFVRVRPDTAGFKSESEAGVAGAGTSLGKIFVAAFAAVGVADVIKKTVEAAVSQQQTFAILGRTIENAGAANQVHGETVDNLVKQQAALKGFSVNDISVALGKLESVTRNTSKAFELLGAAENLSRGTGKDLTTSALAVEKAYEGSATSLARYGIIIRPVAADVEALRQRWAAATDAGVVFTAQQKAQQAEEIKTATLADKILTGQEAIVAIQQRFGGEASVFAHTATGEYDRLKVSVDQLAVVFGTAFLPEITAGLTTLTSWTERLAANKQFTDEARQAAHDFATALHEVVSGVELIGPPLLSVTSDLGGFVRVAELVGAVYLGSKLLTWAGGLTAVAASDTEAAGATTLLTDALAVNTAALEANTVALGGDAAATVTLGAASEGAAAKVGILDAGLAGMLGLLTKIGLAYLIVNQAIKALPGEHDLGLDFSNNTAGFAAGRDGSPFQAGSPLDQLYQAGRLGEHGPILHLAGGATAAFTALGAAERKAYEEGLAKSTGGSSVGGLLGSAASLFTGVAGAGQAALASAANAAKTDVTTGKTHTILTEAAQLAIQQLQQGLALANQQQQDLNQQMADAVAQGAIAVQQAVQQAQQNFISIGQGIATDIGTYIDIPLTNAGNALQLQADRIAAIQQGIVARFAGQNAILDKETAQIALRSAELTLRHYRESITLPGGVALSADSAVALRQLERYQATVPASSRGALQGFIDQFQSDVIAVQKAQIALAEASPVKRAQESANIALRQSLLRATQDRATIEKTAATASINDWAAMWETKTITLAQFNADVAGLIRRDIGRLSNVAHVPGGFLIEQQLKGAISGVAAQALAIQQGPQQPGAGFLPSIVHPLTALQNEQKQIASIAHQDATTQATIQTDMRGILKQIYSATKDTAGLASLAHNPATQAQVRAALAGATG